MAHLVKAGDSNVTVSQMVDAHKIHWGLFAYVSGPMLSQAQAACPRTLLSDISVCLMRSLWPFSC